MSTKQELKIKLKKDDVPSFTGTQRAALWDVSDYRRVNECYFKFTRLNLAVGNIDKANETITEFHINLDKRWNDHKNVKIDDSFCNDYFEPLQVDKVNNKTTLGGIEVFVLILANRSNAFPTFMASGTSQLSPSIGQPSLIAENARTPMSTSGWLSPARNILRQGGIFATGIPSALLAEFGSYNDAVEGTLFFRVVLSTLLQHIQNITYYTASHETEFRPG